MNEELENQILSTVKKTIDDYQLIADGEKVLVAVSGGKDSMSALYILKKLGYDVEAIIIDQLLGEYSKNNLKNTVDFCKAQDVKLHIVHMRDEYGCSVCYMKSVLDQKGQNLNQCMICGVIRRNILNRWGKRLGVTKVATGHNLDDEAQTFLMNYIQANISRSARLGPKSGITEDKRFVQRIKPLHFILEKDIVTYARSKGFPVVFEACPCSKDSFRSYVKEILNKFEQARPGTKESMVKGFMDMMPQLERMHPKNALRDCSLCGEPASNDICKTCTILGSLKPVKCE